MTIMMLMCCVNVGAAVVRVVVLVVDVADVTSGNDVVSLSYL